MKLTAINLDINTFPKELQTFLSDASCLYDSSCSPKAKVIYIDDGDNGYFLKSASTGTLKREAEMTQYFYTKGLSAKLVKYVSAEQDWLLTEKIYGDDCTTEKYLDQPEKLCDIIAEKLAILHDMDYSDCPIQNHTKIYLQGAKENFQKGIFSRNLLPDYWELPKSAEEAFKTIERKQLLLETNTLLHGDYCLPNIILNDWKLSGFVDFDNGGVGDRHIDLFWGIWTLEFNLKTSKYSERFMDVYGRNKIDEERLQLISAIEVFG